MAGSTVLRGLRQGREHEGKSARWRTALPSAAAGLERGPEVLCFPACLDTSPPAGVGSGEQQGEPTQESAQPGTGTRATLLDATSRRTRVRMAQWGEPGHLSPAFAAELPVVAYPWHSPNGQPGEHWAGEEWRGLLTKPFEALVLNEAPSCS